MGVLFAVALGLPISVEYTICFGILYRNRCLVSGEYMFIVDFGPCRVWMKALGVGVWGSEF